MKKFRFRLERVLDFRNSEKKEKERELAERNYELQTSEERLDQIVEAQDREKIEPGSVMTMAELALAGRYQTYLRLLLEKQRDLVKEAAVAVEEAKDAYLKKAVETETLETLKSRKKEEFNLEKKKAAKKELDEMVVQRHRLGKTRTGEDNE